MFAIATFCQSTSAPPDQEEKEQHLRAASKQIPDAMDHYRGWLTGESSRLRLEAAIIR